ncbi:D-aminoacyl-tRNA deacylase [Halosimplex halobium]|uniref:D-aminoacyl-tRNA deacylase n=1 Tax=Halosimplex halobium TaxID=3396618 RepID=UPI003F56F162
MLAVAVSRDDSASVHIGERLRAVTDWTEHTDGSRPDAEGGGTVYRTDSVELRAFDALHLDLDGVADAFGRVDGAKGRTEPDLLVFASRHAGETGPLLTAHHTGNFGPAEYGGEPGAFARACPNAHRRVLAALREHAPEGYEVGMEATHHGPTDVGVPSMFVEVGSDEPQWGDPDAAEAVARAILALRGTDPDAPDEDGTRRYLVGFGGGHYAPRFERILAETDWAVGHVAPDWGLDAMGDPERNREVIRRAFAASAADYAVVEGDRPDLEGVVDDLGYRAVSETWVRETTGVPLALVAAVEDRLGSVEAGVRFGERAAGYEGDPDGGDLETVALPDDLLAEAQGIDHEAARAAVERATVAFETTESGTRAEGRALVDADRDGAALVEGLAAVLEAKYETVERAEGTVVARESAFDPERARTLGVPDGPKLGRLAEGEPVTVDGEEIDPAVVHVEREHRFPVDGLSE